MLVGHGSAWMEIGKTLNSLGFGSGGFELDLSGLDFSYLDNVQTEAKKAEKQLQDNINKAQSGRDGPLNEDQAVKNATSPIASEPPPSGPPAAATPPVESSEGIGTQEASDVGTTDYAPVYVTSLGEVKDPDKAFADVAKSRDRFVRGTVRPFEKSLLGEIDGDELIQEAPMDVYKQTTLGEDIAARNLSRFGVAETSAARMQRMTGNQLVRTIGVTDAVNNARLQQDTSNQELLNSLVNAAQGINKTALESLGTAAGLQINRENAYSSARAASRSQKYGFVGSLLSAI